MKIHQQFFKFSTNKDELINKAFINVSSTDVTGHGKKEQLFGKCMEGNY